MRSTMDKSSGHVVSRRAQVRPRSTVATAAVTIEFTKVTMVLVGSN